MPSLSQLASSAVNDQLPIWIPAASYDERMELRARAGRSVCAEPPLGWLDCQAGADELWSVLPQRSIVTVDSVCAFSDVKFPLDLKPNHRERQSRHLRGLRCREGNGITWK